MKKGTRDTVLGLVFFGGLGLLLWATQQLSGVSFAERQELNVEFENARGLRVGEPVFVLGTQLGKVASVSIDPKGEKVIAELQLDTSLALKSDTLIEVVDASMLGGKRVDITPGRSGTEVRENHTFSGQAPLGPLESLGGLVSGEENKENLQGALKAIRDFFEKLNKGEGSLSRLIEDDTLIRRAEELMESLRRSALKLETNEGLIGKLINDPELGRKAESILTNADAAIQKLNSNDSPLGKLLNDTILARRIDKIMTDVDTVTTRLTGTESALGRLINDPELGKKVDTIVTDLAEVTQNLKNPEAGLLGALIHDPALLADGRRILSEFAQVATNINTGKGVLARLINDEDMGRRLDSMLRQLTRAIEDAREAAPVGTFFQVFSGAF